MFLNVLNKSALYKRTSEAFGNIRAKASRQLISTVWHLGKKTAELYRNPNAVAVLAD